MNALRVWCLIALFAIVRCQDELQASGGGVESDNGDDFEFVPDDEDSDNDYGLGSGSGAGAVSPQNITAAASASTQRSTIAVKIVASTSGKSIRASQPPVVTTTKPQPTVTSTILPLVDGDIYQVDNEKDDDDEDDEEPDSIDSGVDSDDADGIPTSTSAVSKQDDAKRTTTSEPSANTTRDLFGFIWKQPGIMAGLIGGAILGVLFAILLTLFVIYRLRRRADRGAYRRGGSRGSQDDTGAFWFDDEDGAIAVSRASAERYPQTQVAAAGAGYMNPQAAGTLKGSQMLVMPPAMNYQTQQQMYASLAPSGQTAYDEYLANLYNQQLYNGFIQQKA